MTERTSHPPNERDYLPGLGKHFLLPFYDVVHHLFGLAPIHQEMITLAGLRAGHRVLDVGCGTGNLLRSTGKRHRDVELVGLDPDPKALARARRKARRGRHVMRLDRGFAQELPYPDGSFDLVFSSLMLHHLDTASKDAMLAEVRRVLRPDGVLILADVVRDGHDHHAHRRIGTGRQMHEHLHDNIGDAVPKRIAAAGFTVEPTRTKTLRLGGTIGIEVARPR
ncbi:MAG TPA: class I SAM-dependent methyltransferase [Actinophytocola sp.]|uniref:class I SAM-dependent methyltransferase n=1 Tax=Actinophytocola sp. TaxID=1872138 RepID=UPI002DBBB2A4|nr:class I SAM-dependent methyltransferase [Actinophytocola sp.]HEU5474963.1 class I SAM-dependent methyltransferase [Actinophytocola sp.]